MDGKPVDGKRSWNLIHVMIHELGHTLGLMHDEHLETSDVMDPYYNAKMLDLSDWDITRIRNLYPVRTFGGRWHLYSRLKRWLVKRKRRF
jgi:predicted Zn-dependent protease